MFLGEGQQDHDGQGDDSASGYDVLHGCHSTLSAHCIVRDCAARDTKL
jgi:hypothetical protein